MVLEAAGTYLKITSRSLSNVIDSDILGQFNESQPFVVVNIEHPLNKEDSTGVLVAYVTFRWQHPLYTMSIILYPDGSTLSTKCPPYCFKYPPEFI